MGVDVGVDVFVGVGVCVGVDVGADVFVGVGVCVGAAPADSYAPMSQPAPCGRATPRWSVAGQAAAPPTSMAGLPTNSA